MCNMLEKLFRERKKNHSKTINDENNDKSSSINSESNDNLKLIVKTKIKVLKPEFDKRRDIAVNNIQRMKQIDVRNSKFYNSWIEILNNCVLKDEDELQHYQISDVIEAFDVIDEFKTISGESVKFIWFYDIVRMTKLDELKSIQLDIKGKDIFAQGTSIFHNYYKIGEDFSFYNYDKIILLELPYFTNKYTICDGNHKLSQSINKGEKSIIAQFVDFPKSICCLADLVDFLIILFIFDYDSMKKGYQPKNLAFIKNNPKILVNDNFRKVNLFINN